MTIREVLNKIFWDRKENPFDYEIIYIHRGLPDDQRSIPFSLVKKVEKSFFFYIDNDSETYIPFHRILWIRNIRTNKIIYRKRNIKKAS